MGGDHGASGGIELSAEEPRFEPVRVIETTRFAAELRARLAQDIARPAVVAVDGRSGSGKTTLAGALASSIDGACVVSTDDVAWHHSFFGWSDLLVDEVLVPLHAGRAVHFRPPAWRARGRRGAISVPAGRAVVIVEGVGAARHEVAPLLDAAIWVQSDLAQAKQRCLARDAAVPAAEAFWHEWAEAELPFVAAERPWERADAVVVNDDRDDPPDVVVATTAWRPY